MSLSLTVTCLSRPEVKEEVKRSISLTVACLSRPEVKEEVKRSTYIPDCNMSL